MTYLFPRSEVARPTIINSCRTCGNAWTEPPPSTVNYHSADFHASTIAFNSEDDEILRTVNELPEQWKRSVLMQAQLLTRYLRPRAKILEIGCGEGILLSELSRLGFNVQGIEPSEAASLRTRKKGIDCITGYFPYPEIQEPFDAVILSHVLEHLQNPLETLEKIAAIAPQGYLLLVQTHYRGLLPRLLRWRWYAWVCGEHYWHFTPEGLAYITRNLNFTPVTCEFSSLVHEDRLLTRFTERAGSVFPLLYDQFHILFKMSKD